MRSITVLLSILLTSFTLQSCRAANGEKGSPGPLTPEALFDSTRVWTAHLRFTAEQWKAIQPTQGEPTGRTRATGGEWLQGREGMRNGWAAARGIQFDYTPAILEFEGLEPHTVAVRFKGNGTYNARSVAAEKNSFKIDLNKYDKARRLAGVTTLNLHNGITDPSWMNEVLALRLYRDAGVPAPRTTYVRVYLSVEGLYTRSYRGLYIAVENVDDDFLQHHFGTQAGALLKPVSVDPFTDLGEDWTRYVQPYDPKGHVQEREQRRVIALCKLVSHGSDGEFSRHVGEYIDLPLFARYLAVVGWMNNHDSILKNGQNYYVWLNPQTERLQFFPWDQDHSWGTFPQQAAGSHAREDIGRPWPDPVRFLDRVFAVPGFRTAYLNQVRDLQATIFDPKRVPQQVAEIAAVIRPSIAEEPPKLPGVRLSAGVSQLEEFDRLTVGGEGPSSFAALRWRAVDDQLRILRH